MSHAEQPGGWWQRVTRSVAVLGLLCFALVFPAAAANADPLPTNVGKNGGGASFVSATFGTTNSFTVSRSAAYCIGIYKGSDNSRMYANNQAAGSDFTWSFGGSFAGSKYAILRTGCSDSSTLPTTLADPADLNASTSWAKDGYIPVTGPPATAACQLTDVQIAAYAYQAGFRNASPQNGNTGLTWAVAAALAVSGGDAGKVTAAGGSYKLGLWQMLASETTYTERQLLDDPSRNALAAWSLSSSGTTFAYWNLATVRPMLARASAAVGSYTQGGMSVAADVTCTAESGSDSGDGTQCYFSINPLQMVKCALRWAFVPSSSTTSQYSNLASNLSTRPPFSLVASAFQAITGFATELANASAPCVSPARIDVPGVGSQGFPNRPGASDGGNSIDYGCATFVSAEPENSSHTDGAAQLSKNAMRVVIVGIGGMAMYRTFMAGFSKETA